MAREKGDLINCLEALIHHIAPHKARLMVLGGYNTQEDIEYRFGLVRGEAELVLKQIERIREVAQNKGYKEILDIINEELEYGHDLNISR
ncbi:MAG: hypothetical protein HY764_03810 [Candidatus Portnoybacteria bacterium]|nr:hypothetical protein [Candidatus Portnoybacteria bacterium]